MTMNLNFSKDVRLEVHGTQERSLAQCLLPWSFLTITYQGLSHTLKGHRALTPAQEDQAQSGWPQKRADVGWVARKVSSAATGLGT